MGREIHHPLSKESWLKLKLDVISSTEVAALFGLSPWATKYEVWHQKKNRQVVEIEESDPMFWGTVLQPAIAEGAAKKNGWNIRPMNEFITLPNKIGSSFDYRVRVGQEDSDDDAILETKNIGYRSFKEGWLVDEDGNIEAPTMYELQVQHQMLVSGLKKAYLVALVGGQDLKVLERQADQNVQVAILDHVGKFWRSIQKNEPPPIDWQRDAEFIISLNQSVTKDKLVDPTIEMDQLVTEYKDAMAAEKLAVEKKKEAKAKLLIAMGDAQKVKGEGYSISASEIKDTFIEGYTRKGYRDFRIHYAKDTK